MNTNEFHSLLVLHSRPCNDPGELMKHFEIIKYPYDMQNLTRNFAVKAWNTLKSILKENNITIDDPKFSFDKYLSGALEGEQLTRKYEGRAVCISMIISVHTSFITSYYFDNISKYLGDKRKDIEKKLKDVLVEFIRDYIKTPNNVLAYSI